MPKHHYVPQFYWKRFGNGKYVSAILMDYNFRFVERASIRDQSCKPDYYELPEVERLNGLMEREASFLMQNIVRRVPLTEINPLPQAICCVPDDEDSCLYTGHRKRYEREYLVSICHV